jgi:hypothetical protein
MTLLGLMRDLLGPHDSQNEQLLQRAQQAQREYELEQRAWEHQRIYNSTFSSPSTYFQTFSTVSPGSYVEPEYKASPMVTEIKPPQKKESEMTRHIRMED